MIISVARTARRRNSRTPAQRQEQARRKQEQTRQKRIRTRQKQHETRQKQEQTRQKQHTPPAPAPVIVVDSAPPAAKTTAPAPPVSDAPSHPRRGRPPDTVVVFTADLPQPANIPTKLAKLLNEYDHEIQNWIHHLVIQQCGACDPDHELTILNQEMDLTAMIETCAAYRSPDMGAPATYSIEHLVRAEIIRALYADCSDEELADMLRRNITVRMYVGLSLFGDTPSAATLRRFHTWLCDTHPTLFFEHVLDFLNRVDPHDIRATPAFIDTFALLSPAAAQSPTVVLMRLTASIMTIWQTHAPARLHTILPADLDLEQLRTGRVARTKEKEARQIQYAVHDARRVVAAITPHLDAIDPAVRDVLTERCAQIKKVIDDETTTNEAGEVVWIAKKDRGTYRMLSLHDHEATFRKHGDDPARFGYNAAVIANANTILGVAVATGSTPDGELVVPALQGMIDRGQDLPQFLGGDQAFGWGKIRHAVAMTTDGQTTLVARTPAAGGKDPARYGPDQFVVTRYEAGQPVACACPNHVTSTASHTSGAGEGVRFRFKAAQCEGCPLWTECRGENGNPTANRDVFLSDYHAYLRQALWFNETPLGKRILRERWHIEPEIAFLVRYDGCRQARRVGRAAAEFQLYQAAAARNLRKWVARRAQKKCPAAEPAAPAPSRVAEVA